MMMGGWLGDWVTGWSASSPWDVRISRNFRAGIPKSTRDTYMFAGLLFLLPVVVVILVLQISSSPSLHYSHTVLKGTHIIHVKSSSIRRVPKNPYGEKRTYLGQRHLPSRLAAASKEPNAKALQPKNRKH